jgi:hypothetical protein
MWRRRMTQHSLVTTRLIIIVQHRGDARKPKSNCSMSLKGAKSLWWCRRSRGPILLPSAIRRDGDNAIVIFRIDGVLTVQEWSHNTTDIKIQEYSIDFTNLESINFKVPMVCLVTGCVSRRWDGRYTEWTLSKSCVVQVETQEAKQRRYLNDIFIDYSRLSMANILRRHKSQLAIQSKHYSFTSISHSLNSTPLGPFPSPEQCKSHSHIHSFKNAISSACVSRTGIGGKKSGG